MLCNKLLDNFKAMFGVLSYIIQKNRGLWEFLEPITETFSKDR